MFGNNMMSKLGEMKQRMEESKARLDHITVEGEAYEGAVKVIATGNRTIKDVQISDKLMHDRTELEDMLVLAMNRAIEQADRVNEAEMQGTAKDFLPPGFGV